MGALRLRDALIGIHSSGILVRPLCFAAVREFVGGLRLDDGRLTAGAIGDYEEAVAAVRAVAPGTRHGGDAIRWLREQGCRPAADKMRRLASARNVAAHPTAGVAAEVI